MTRPHKALLTLSVFFLLLFIGYTYIVHLDVLNGADRSSTIQLQKWIPKAADPFLSFFSLIGSFEIMTVILIVILFFRRRLQGLAVLGIYLGTQVLEVLGKTYITHPGPPFEFFRYDLDFLFPSTNLQPGSAYPSGHSMRTMFVIILISSFLWSNKALSQRQKIIYSVFIGVFAVVMLISRVSLGEHWTTDVIGGALLAAASAFLSIIFI